MKFKSNIKCAACVAKVKSTLDEVVGEGKWSVDLSDPNRILTVERGDPEKINENLKRVGYSAEKIS